MVYIVMDLEWNQSALGKSRSVVGLPFEIIEIGAVKLNENRQVLSQFQQLVRPAVYKKLHFAAKELLHISEKELKKGIPFPEAMRDFLAWCSGKGEMYRFCTWGSSDLLELQRNCHYYHMEHCFENPLFYYDIQKGYALDYAADCKENKNVSLEAAVEHLSIPVTGSFHRALADAQYTVSVFKGLSMNTVLSYPSVDYYQLPKTKKQEIHMVFPTYEKLVSKKYVSKEQAINDRTLRTIYCPVCKKHAKRKIRWFTNNLRNYYSMSTCEEHGFIRGKMRVRRHDDGGVYVIRTIRFASEEELEKMCSYAAVLRKKKRKHREIK